MAHGEGRPGWGLWRRHCPPRLQKRGQAHGAAGFWHLHPRVPQHSVKAGSRRWADVAIEKKLRAKELSAGSPAPCRNAHQTLFLNRTLYLGASFCWGKKMMQKPWILPKDCRLQPGINSPVPRYTTLQQGCRAPLLRMFFGPQQKILTKFCSEDSYCLCILDSSLQDFTC